MKQTVEIELGGRSLQLETGSWAKQAGGSVIVASGDTRVLVTATCSNSPREGIDFFPLTVDYREYTYAAGRFPGGYIKREGRPTEKEVLTSRLIDRPIRPLFTNGFTNETQVIAMVLSADPDYDPAPLALAGASAALSISNVPFETTIGAVEVSRIDDQWVINPSYEQRSQSTLTITVAAAKEGIVMVEAIASEVNETEVIEAIRQGHEACCKIIDAIDELVNKAGKTKIDVEPPPFNQDLYNEINDRWGADLADALDTHKHPKLESYTKVNQLKDAVQATYSDDKKAAEASKLFNQLKEDIFRRWILEEKRRPDKRAYDEIRDITCEIGVLPRAHGSAVFTRGETQALATVTLGTKEDGQRQEKLEDPNYEKRFMVHYNFPPFSVGEVSFLRGAGRREIGHGMLGERALSKVVPSYADFPYTVRVVSDILESNGSSSMATICGGTLALMDAGVPMSAPVAGIAMGLVAEGENFAVLTDIAGAEDHYGDMDFKVAGTSEGVVALQMDIKQPNVSFEILEQALAQANKARLEILETMNNAIAEPRVEMSPHAPRIHKLTIPVSKIRDVIGPGGKVIRGIVEETGVKVDVSDDGTVQIASTDSESAKKAIQMVKDLTASPEVGKTYLGKVTRIVDFGAFVEIFPGTEGLLHISEIAEERIRDVRDELKLDDQILVKCLQLEGNKIRLSRRAVLREQRGEEPEDDRSGNLSPNREGVKRYGGGRGRGRPRNE